MFVRRSNSEHAEVRGVRVAQFSGSFSAAFAEGPELGAEVCIHVCSRTGLRWGEALPHGFPCRLPRWHPCCLGGRGVSGIGLL